MLRGVQDGTVASSAAEGGGSGGEDQATQTYDENEDMGMAPVDMEQSMGSFSPEWSNSTVL